VIDNAAVGFRCVARDISASVPCGAQERKQRNSNGKWREREPSAGRCARTATGPRQAAAPRQARRPAHKRQLPQPGRHSQRHPPAAVQPAQQALIDDDIPSEAKRAGW